MEQKPIPVFAIPILNRGDLLLRLVQSIDYPVKKLFIINNGTDAGVVDAIAKIMKGINKNILTCEVYVPQKNLGVAASWNTIMRENADAPYCFICANDMFFEHAGHLKRMADFAAEKHLTHAMMYADGYSCFCMTKLGLEQVGEFDENIFPAYLEDSDHFYRLKLSGAVSQGFPDVEMRHGEPPYNGSATIMSNEKFRDANAITHGKNFEYYAQKWGGEGGKEVFTHPFNNPENSIKFWELDVERRKIQEAAWGI